ncbi:hypothetical protein Pmar_PMAR002411 [Perkinsus marinus ATCC 50983]|uniref:Uncharacterized protein n=1 Tax=Perkinsus marinus (strain ATCC 50983 / TXsc) TaxID=423536 RepID=C5LYV8_PERM5|nr:hypothetical protein Pmar_PMAR002411 [Perkinsus marinus ATCC 50983]EEQ98132.1 hypothetical protein Pmar_PMAR002411 [Perkinsus marinus ATCC 50983]|eukprot:XP_002765415.1 hypothetical protein Pmar_PMAR002411 [Perkinsus marinus ATCC 50983]
MDKVDVEQQGCASASVKGKVTEGESDGIRRDRFGCVIMSKSKSHSLCFADEVPGANRESLVFTVNVESFKKHNGAFNHTAGGSVAFMTRRATECFPNHGDSL